MKFAYRNSVFVVSTIVLITLIGLLAVPIYTQAAPSASPQADLERAWTLAQQSGRYNFTTRLVQTTHPAPSVTNVGRGSRVETVYLEGETDLAADVLVMRVWQDGGRLQSRA